MKHIPLRFIASPLAMAIATAIVANGATADPNLPQGGQVIGGQATITQQGNNMDVNTSTDRTAINWHQFNVGPDNKITFNQPGGHSITLNRVIGGDASKIYGAITSNGQLILVNPNGIMFGPKSHVSARALVASAGFVTEEQARQFAETGKLHIQLTGNVENQGRITVHDNGMVALLGAQVKNAGVIQAKKGMVQLATGPQATLDFYGDGMLNIAVNGEPRDKNSVNADVKGGVENTGEIDVGNGVVAMSATRAAKHLDSVIHIGGNVVADSMTEDGGTIVLGHSDKTEVTGNLSAKGVNGGQIKVLGDEVKIAGTAKIDASGTQGTGGKVLVGGGYQGKGEPAAKHTTVAKGAQLKADGKTDGGQVVVWSDGKTEFAGSASAKGEKKGGVVETSGKQLTVAPEAQVDASGKQASGKWLLDPETVNIEANGGAPGSDTVSAGAIASGLKNSDVEINASQRINVNSAIIAQDAGYHTLRLMANGTVAPVSVYNETGNPFADAKRNDSGSVYINAPILLKDGHLYIVATGDVMLNNTTGTQAGDAGYMGRAIIDVGNGTIWIKTSKSASVIQQQGTALIGNQVGVEGASVLLDSPLNHAGTLAGKASNGKFIYNQTSNNGVNTGKVQITQGDVTETMDGVSSSIVTKLGEQWIWERTGDQPHHLTIDENTPFQYLVFEALEYVDHKDHKPIAGDKTDSDYWVSKLTFKDPTTGDTWVVSSNPAVASGISVTKNGVATSELPPGFALGTNQGTVTASANGWGIVGGTGDQNNPAASNAINRHGATNTSDKLVVDLGTNTSAVDAEANELWHTGNKYESGTVSFLGGKDTSKDGGVTLKSQTAQLEGKIEDAQREYGEANPTFNASVGLPADASENSKAVKGVDDFVDRQLNQNRFADTKVTPSTDATPSSNVGDYAVNGTIDASGFVGQRYQTTVKPGTLHVTPAELTVTAKDHNKVYGDADPTLGYDISGAKLGQTGEQLLNGGALNRDAGENVGAYGVHQGQLGLNNGLGGNYTLKFVDGKLQITPATLTVTADDKTKVYGDADPALTYQVSGLKNGDTRAQVLSDGSVKRAPGENVGKYGITNDNLALLSSNYILEFKDGVFSITPAELTVTAKDNQKVYGDADPGFTYEVTGLKRGDTASGVLNGGALNRDAGENVGKYGIHQGTLDLNGEAGQNYVLHYVDGDFYITPATLTVDADGKTKVYGDFDPALTFRVSGLKNGDSQSDVLAGALQRAPGEDVGTYGISQGSLDLTSGKGQNYVLSFTGNDFTITPASLTVTAEDKTKVYGDLDPQLTYTVSGLKNGDSQADVLNSGSVSRAPGENVGNYAIGQGTLGLNEGKGGNYVLSFVDGNLAITPATLTVEAQDKSKVYGDADPALTHIVSGLKNGDTAADVLNGGTVARDAGENVGQYGIHQGGLALNDGQGSNYVLQFKDGVFSITPAELTVTAKDNQKVYGDADPGFTYEVTGLKRGDTASGVLNGGALNRDAGENVGKYGIHQGTLDLNGEAGQNYVLHYVDGDFYITPATLTVDADGKTKVYGDFDPALTFRVSGLKNGDSQSDVLAGALQRAPGEDVGTYGISQGSLDLTSGKGQNYVLSFTGNDFTITPASLTVTAEDKTKVYGDLDPQLTYTVSGLKNGDSQADVLNSGSVSRAPGENVGNYAIGQGTLGLNEGKGGNYVLSFVDGNLAITPATLTVEAQDKSKVYGDADPALTHIVSGLKNGDTAADVLNGGALVRDAGENVGSYGIHQGSLALNNAQGSNYVLQFVDGKLTITPASLTVTADNAGKVYGDLDPALTYSISGLKGGDSAADVLNGGKLAREAGENVGAYGIGQGDMGLNGGKGQNYILTYQAGTFTITPATLVVRGDDKTKVYGQIDPALSYQVSGLKRDDTASSVLQGNLVREAGENVKSGGYAIQQGDLSLISQNYLLQYENGTLTITPASLQVDFDDKSKVYGEIDPSLTYRVTGLVNGDTAETVLSGAGSRAPGENVGNYAIGQGSLAANGNYILTVHEGALAITPAELTVSADDKTKVYGDLDPSLTYQVSGLKNGDSADAVVSGNLSRVEGEDVRPEGYAITQGNVVLTSGNYRMVFKDGKLQVTPAPLVVKADNQTKVQGESDPALTYSVSGLKRGDSAGVVQGQLKREPGETAGRYKIDQDGSFSAGSNYTVSFEGGALTITGPLAPVSLPPLPVTAQSPGNVRCEAIESPSAVSANYSVSPAVIRTYDVQLICKPRSYGDATSTVPNILDVLTYANSRFQDGKFIVPDWNRSVIPNQFVAPAKGGK